MSDPAMRARAESDLSNMHAKGDANIVKYATKGEDGQLKIDQNSIDKYILDNVSAAALDRTKARVEKDNTYKMFMYEEQQKAVRHAQTLAATERKNETTRLSSLIQTDAKSNILSSKVNFAVNSINSAVAGISLFIAGVGVMNMMYISVSERTKEIGIRRALGATQNSIRMQFLLEGVTLTLFGGVVGYIVGISLAYIIGSIIDIPISIEFFTVFLAISVSTGIGLIFSVMPASAAAKKDLIETLR